MIQKPTFFANCVFFLHVPPLSVAEHLRLVLVGNDAAAFLANINGELCPVCVAHALIVWEVDL